MQVSRDSGATWQAVSLPAHTPLLSDWFVDATGLLYDTAKYIGSPCSGNQWLAPGSISALQSFYRPMEPSQCSH